MPSVRVRRPSGSRPGRHILSELANLKTVAGLLFVRSGCLSDSTDADHLTYLAQRIEAHADKVRQLLDADAAALGHRKRPPSNVRPLASVHLLRSSHD